MGGGTVSSLGAIVIIIGLSPRGRGNQEADSHVGLLVRSIPAWAGEPTRNESPLNMIWVYPRVGGGTGCRHVSHRSPVGLSPRGRGNPGRRRYYPSHNRSIPAWAGEPLMASCPALRNAVYPRVGGGTLLIPQQQLVVGQVYPRVGGGTSSMPLRKCRSSGLSPRGRGKQPG